MTARQDEWNHILARARWYELPQRAIGIEAVAGLVVAFLGLVLMFTQFFLALAMSMFWFGLVLFVVGSGAFAWAERSQLQRVAWLPQRKFQLEVRGDSHRCLHLEGPLPENPKDGHQAHCHYFDKTFQGAPLCVYCQSYSPFHAPLPEEAARPHTETPVAG